MCRRTPSALALGMCLGLLACDREPVGDTATPAPVETAKPDVCEAEHSEEDDEFRRVMPLRIGGFCLDPNHDVRLHGEEAESPIEQICTELPGAPCNEPGGHRLRRVLTSRYIRSDASRGAISVRLLRFSNGEAAYGYFTDRVLTSEDPAQNQLEAVEVAGQAVLGRSLPGAESALLWRGRYVLLLSYGNEQLTPAQLKEQGRPALEQVLGAFGGTLDGDTSLPAVVRRLPTKERIALGVRLSPKDSLGVSGAGPGAVGYYQRGPKRYRIFVSATLDADTARDVERTLRRTPGYRKLKDMPYDAFELELSIRPDAPSATWLVAKRDATVVAVGDEQFALTADMTDEQKLAVALSRGDKLRLLRQVLFSRSEPHNR